ncbi:hypothetical protein WR164_02340 [Philodulcilactobacillus myokoensis]|uniref:Uncharacterized protein n=1 Tax=Philodulcilactobacillus myokoensis TaxID=2929573 RepID=A0A9W6AZB3_9LACO|nr:hypothetical protein [Philodulcilactobacillus myokoensis]GLB46255.1 hypothetical protein WR164_02340 [Philodulcilactobacillus myokoensis]
MNEENATKEIRTLLGNNQYIAIDEQSGIVVTGKPGDKFNAINPVKSTDDEVQKNVERANRQGYKAFASDQLSDQDVSDYQKIFNEDK